MKKINLEIGPNLSTDIMRNPDIRNIDTSNFVGSGKAALGLILSYLSNQGVFSNKMDEILMPKWIGTWVYSQVLDYAFPTNKISKHTKAVLCYHQYGFPQNMEKVISIAADNKFIIIEDCAHTIGGSYKGKPLGTFGDFTLYSYSKFLFCYSLGSAHSQDRNFIQHIRDNKHRSSKFLNKMVNLFKFIDTYNLCLENPLYPDTFNSIRKMAFSRYGDNVIASDKAISLWLRNCDKEKESRIKNYDEIRLEINKYGICDHLEEREVIPYALPLYLPEPISKHLIADLAKEKIYSGIYHFDFARCIFEPQFRKVVLVPIHSGMSGRGIDLLISMIKKHYQ